MVPIKISKNILILLFAVMTLAACGGGGGSGGAPTDTGDVGGTVTGSSNWDEMKWDEDNWG